MLELIVHFTSVPLFLIFDYLNLILIYSRPHVALGYPSLLIVPFYLF